MTDPKEIVGSFVADRLGGDIRLLASYDLTTLRDDSAYGCPGRQYDPDDTTIARAAYCLLYGGVWPDLTMESLAAGRMRGDTLNTYNTLFSPPWRERFIEKWQPDDAFLARRRRFLGRCFTLANMAVLPEGRIGEWTINRHRGCHDEWHDYEDRFLLALHAVLTDEPGADADLADLVGANARDFAPFRGPEGWRRFVEGNLLTDYTDARCRPVVRSLGYTCWRGGYTRRERFLAECDRYMAGSTAIIEGRARSMTRLLAAAL